MPDYSKAVIYKLCCKDLSIKDIYIGSTCNFTKRKHQHKFACNKEGNRQYNENKYQVIRDNGGWDNWLMIMVKEFSCDNKRQLEAEERKNIEELKPTLNECIPTRTHKEYRQDNKQIIIEKKKKEYEKDKEKIKARSHKRYNEKKEEILKKQKEYNKINSKKNVERVKQYRLENKEKIQEARKEKIECMICKCMVNKEHFKRHTQTTKHIQNSS